MTGSLQRHLRLALAAACALVVGLTVVALVEYFGSAFLSGRSATEEAVSTSAIQPTTPAKGPAQMSLHDTPQVMPDLRFEDDSGRPLTLAGFAGKVVLLNIWATWCIPCREEMPTLDRLQAQLGSPAFHVVALSIDRAGVDSVRQFYGEIGIKNLAMYIDSSGQAASALGVVGLPTTLLIDRQGREIGRLVGPAEWDAPEMVAFFRNRLAERTGVAIPAQWRQAAMHSCAETALALHLPLATTVLPSTTAKETHS
jgi:thiol-disulfide isomerase/thioredoxin